MSHVSFASLATIAVAFSALAGVRARAGDAPPAAPPASPAPAAERKPPPPIDHPFLNELVGSWDVVATTMGGEGKGVSRVTKVAGATALVQETRIEIPG